MLKYLSGEPPGGNFDCKAACRGIGTASGAAHGTTPGDTSRQRRWAAGKIPGRTAHTPRRSGPTSHPDGALYSERNLYICSGIV